jgi:hypothetical protein
MKRRRMIFIGCAVVGAVLTAGIGTASAAIVGEPSVAYRGATSTVAWTQGSGPGSADALEIADQTPAGGFARATTLGAASEAPQIASSPDGTQALVWQNGTTLLAATRAVGASAWSAPTTLGQVGVGSAEPTLALAPDDSLVVSWVVRPTDSTMGPVLVATRTAAGVWQPAQTLTAYAADPDVAVDTAGDIAAVFRSDAVYGVALPVGAGSWTPAQQISGAAGYVLEGPQIAAGGERTFVASWTGRGAGLIAARLRSPGAFEPATVVDPREASYGSNQPSLVVGGDGSALVAWPYAPFRIEGSVEAANLSPSATSWDPATDLQDVSIRTDWYIHPNATRLGVDSSGDVVLTYSVWHDLAGDVDMFALTAPSMRGPWTGSTTRIGTSACACAESVAPELAVSPSGAATIAYDAGDGTIAAIHRATPTDAWSAPEKLQPYSLGVAFHMASSKVAHGALSIRVLGNQSAKVSIVVRRPTKARTLAGQTQRVVGGATSGTLVRVPLTASIRKLVARSGRVRLHLAATITDAYGNLAHAAIYAIVRR